MAISAVLAGFLVAVQVLLASAILPANYQSKKAVEKQALLWEKIITEPYAEDALPSTGHSPQSIANLFSAYFHLPSFNLVSDEMPEGRLKLIHPYGSCAKATLEILPTSIYTGIFKAGSKSHAIIRPSVAQWDPTNLQPAMGLKVLIDGRPSENIVTIIESLGQGLNNNFLQNKVSNLIPPPGPDAPPPSPVTQLIVKALGLVIYLLPGGQADRPEGSSNIAVYEPASVENSGRRVPAGLVVAPYKIDFVPNPTLGVEPDSPKDFRVQLSEIPSGIVLYDVRAHLTKEDGESGNEGELIGKVTLDSQLIATKYCDEGLFMQHSKKPHKSF